MIFIYEVLCFSCNLSVHLRPWLATIMSTFLNLAAFNGNDRKIKNMVKFTFDN